MKPYEVILVSLMMAVTTSAAADPVPPRPGTLLCTADAAAGFIFRQHSNA